MLRPTITQVLAPPPCPCGNHHFPSTQPYYTHQVIELPEIEMDVTHLILKRGRCPQCGRTSKALIPPDQRSGFGPRFSALIAEMAGNQGDSRSLIQTFCQSVLGVNICRGTIQKVIDRVSAAIAPLYEAIGQEARKAPVNNIDETSHRHKGALTWLWVMANSTVYRVTNLADCLGRLKDAGLVIVGTAADSPQTIYDTDMNQPLALVIGSEDKGMRPRVRQQCDLVVSIPMAAPEIGSLNAATSGAVALFEARRQRLMAIPQL